MFKLLKRKIINCLCVKMMKKLLGKYKTIWTKIQDLWNIEFNALPFHDCEYMKTKIRTYGDNFYTNFPCLNVPEGGVECESFTIISIDSLFVYESKYYLQLYLDNCAYKIVNIQMVDYLDDIPFKFDIFYLINGSYVVLRWN